MPYYGVFTSGEEVAVALISAEKKLKAGVKPKDLTDREKFAVNIYWEECQEANV